MCRVQALVRLCLLAEKSYLAQTVPVPCRSRAFLSTTRPSEIRVLKLRDRGRETAWAWLFSITALRKQFGSCSSNSHYMKKIIKHYDYDEIERYINTRYGYPPEALYRLFEYPMNVISHIMYRLAVHLQEEQLVNFKEGCENELINRNLSTLTVWF